MTKLSTVLDQVDNGTMLLPEFQRGYVWNRDQVRGLMKSVYRDYPVGALLVWETEVAPDQTRGGGALATAGGQKHLLLDGQQRVTTLYGVTRGRAPGFFDGDASAFTGLYFNVESEDFQFYAPMRMRNDPRWVDVTELFREGTPPFYARLMPAVSDHNELARYFGRLQQLLNVLNRDFHVEQITGPDKTVDVVVDIFNRVNSGGTKLSKGDLALARICSEWDQARPWMRTYLDGWASRGYSFSLDWVLRNTTAVATGRAPFSTLEDVSAAQFEGALKGAKQHIDHLLVTMLERLGVDHDRVVFGKSAFPVLTRLLSRRPGGRFADEREVDKALAWWVHAALRGRFTGPIETALNKDLQIADAEGVDGLLTALLKAQKGSLAIRPEDFEGHSRAARAYPLLYMLTRADSDRDLLTARPFAGTTPSLLVHELFPKSALTKAGYGRAEVNAIANFAFVTHDTAARLGGRLPEDHLPECSPRGLDSQWVPRDPALWSIDRYPDFLRARREMLAGAAERLLTQLVEGTRPWSRIPPLGVDEQPEGPREAQIKALVDELTSLGYTAPAVDVEVPDPDTGRTLAVAEAFWADGLQAGQGQPVVLELDPEEADLARLAELGCEIFTSVDALRAHVQRRNAIASGEQTDEGSVHATASGETTAPAPEAATDDDDEPMTLEAVPAPAAGAFDSAVLELVERCSAELRYNPRYFRVMISQHGALGATRRLLSAPAVSDGFVKLWEHDRLDLTAEALVLEPRFAPLFTDEERSTAKRRLEDFGYRASA